MQALGEILLKYVAPVGIILIAFYYIIEFCKDFESFRKLCSKIKKHISNFLHFVSTKKRKKYDRILASYDFLSFQNQVLEIIYEDEIIKTNKAAGYKCCKRTQMFDVKYESVEIKLKEPISYPFKNVLNKENGCIFNSDLSIKLNNKQKKYKRLIKRTIRKPKKIGYMLNELDLSKGKLSSYCGTYAQNVYTSHYLEYELYLLFKKSKKYNVESLINSRDKKALLDLLPKRKKIHDTYGEQESIFLFGKGRYSLLGVQAMIMVKNHNDSYDVLRIRRGEDVAAKPGFIQFIPSGGFETFENRMDFDTRYANYSLNKAVFRELMEECFGIDEEPDNDHISSEHIYSYKQVSKLIELINNDKAKFELLGSALSLVSLRHELSFVIKIDDLDFAKELSCNYESSGVISSIDVDRLNTKSFWCNYSKDKQEDLYKLNCTSAALFNLVKDSNFFD